MIVKTQDLKGETLIYLLWLVEDGQNHKGSKNMWFFPRRKLSILKNNWKPWANKVQAFDLLEDHNLCVWHDMEGWHAGVYADHINDRIAMFFDAETPAMALCLAAIGKHFGEHVDVPESLLEAA